MSASVVGVREQKNGRLLKSSFLSQSTYEITVCTSCTCFAKIKICITAVAVTISHVPSQVDSHCMTIIISLKTQRP